MFKQIIYKNGSYYVRKLTSIGWAYLDKDGSYWWVASENRRYAAHDTLAQAEACYNRQKTKVVKTL